VLLGMGRPACVWEVGVLLFFLCRPPARSIVQFLAHPRRESLRFLFVTVFFFFNWFFLWYTTGCAPTLQSTFGYLIGYLLPQRGALVNTFDFCSLSNVFGIVFMAINLCAVRCSLNFISHTKEAKFSILLFAWPLCVLKKIEHLTWSWFGGF